MCRLKGCHQMAAMLCEERESGETGGQQNPREVIYVSAEESQEQVSSWSCLWLPPDDRPSLESANLTLCLSFSRWRSELRGLASMDMTSCCSTQQGWRCGAPASPSRTSKAGLPSRLPWIRLQGIMEVVLRSRASALIVDSIQTVYLDGSTGSVGSVTQVGCMGRLPPEPGTKAEMSLPGRLLSNAPSILTRQETRAGGEGLGLERPLLWEPRQRDSS